MFREEITIQLDISRVRKWILQKTKGGQMLKLGLCPICKEDLDQSLDKNARQRIKLKKLFDCPNCSTELFPKLVEKSSEFTFPRDPTYKFSTISMGIEVETFSIDVNNLEIKPIAPIYPKNGIERDEDFKDDDTIGSEYNSAVFSTINEAFFRIKAGLRKYFVNIEQKEDFRIALIGSYTHKADIAGVHYHVGFGKEEGLSIREAGFIAPHIHQHIPFLIAITANSPILDSKMTKNASNRYIEMYELMFSTVDRKRLNREEIVFTSHSEEINLALNRGKNKPPTLEVRVADSNIPEYIIAGLFIIHISIMGAVKGKRKWKHYKLEKFERDKLDAAIKGARASIHWNRAKLTIPNYIDAFFNFYRQEIKESNVPQDVLTVFRLAKKKWVMADILRDAYYNIQKKFNETEDVVKKQFVLKFLGAQQKNLNGENLAKFARNLNVRLPDLTKVRLGRAF